MIQCLQDLSLSFRENWSNAWGSPHTASVDAIVDPVNAILHATDVASVLSILTTGVIKAKSNKSITSSLMELAPERIKRKIKQGRKNMRRKKARKGRSIF